MALKLMYITNNIRVAQMAENAGVDRIFVDMEYIGKSDRQGGMDSVQNHHTVDDVKILRSVIKKSELLVRVNPIHRAAGDCCSSKDEIEAVLEAGADIIMLPYFKTLEEINKFIGYVGGRAKTMLLLETPEAAEMAEEIAKTPGVDEVHIGINDLSLGYGKSFMFELLADGTVEKLCMKLKGSGKPYGFGGIAAIGSGKLPAEWILKEHYRLGSSMVILSRSFCKVNDDIDPDYIREKFEVGIRSIRAFEKEISIHSDYFWENEKAISERVWELKTEIDAEKTYRTAK